jgi:hypothetical protein
MDYWTVGRWLLCIFISALLCKMRLYSKPLSNADLLIHAKTNANNYLPKVKNMNMHGHEKHLETYVEIL